MTGGRVVVLGPTGRNFAAGMSGGIAYVLDETATFARACNTEMVELEPLDEPEEIRAVRAMIERHADYTGSAARAEGARRLGRAMGQVRQGHPQRLPPGARAHARRCEEAEMAAVGDEAIMAAFEENARDLARVGGLERWASRPDSWSTCASCRWTAPRSSASATGTSSTHHLPTRRAARAGRALHGLRRPVLPHRAS